MENCMLLKLKGTSVNESLPVFNEVVEKDWIKTTSENQYFLLSDLLSSSFYKNVVLEIKFKGDLAQNEEANIFRDHQNWLQFDLLGDDTLRYYIHNKAYPSNSASGTISCSSSDEHVLKFDGNTKKVYLDDVEQAGIVIGFELSKEEVRPAYLNAQGTGETITSEAGKISIGYVRSLRADGTERFTFKPYIVNGVAGLHCFDKSNPPEVPNPTGGLLTAYNDEE